MNSRSLSLVVFAFFWSNEVDGHLDMFANEPFPDEFPCFLGVKCLTGVGEPTIECQMD